MTNTVAYEKFQWLSIILIIIVAMYNIYLNWINHQRLKESDTALTSRTDAGARILYQYFQDAGYNPRPPANNPIQVLS